MTQISAAALEQPVKAMLYRHLSLRRRITNNVATGFFVASFLIALVPLVWLLAVVIARGWHAVVQMDWWTHSLRGVLPEEFTGGSLTVSNLGMYGIKNFTSIINPPQSCIIAVGAGEERPIVVNGKIEIATMMTVTMSADHRVVDGGTGAKFLQTLKQFIEEPASMLL